MSKAPTIYHGTPLTPRAALLSVCTGRAMCVSFYRPDDVEAVEAISPDIMFRQRRIFHVEGCTAARRGMGREMGLVGLFRLVGTSLVSTGQMGGCAGYAGRSVTAQRCARGSMAVRTEGRAPLAHGRTNRAPSTALRQVGSCLPWLDRRGQASGQARISRTHGRSGQGIRQPLARSAHDARDRGGLRLPVRECGRDNSSTERVAL
jgi:hypothetical protein